MASPQSIRSGVALLRERGFRRLFGARMVSAFGSSMAPIAVAFGVLDLTGSADRVGVVVAAQIIAQVLFQLLGGALADRGSRKRLMVGADLLAAVCQATMAGLFLSGSASIPALIALMAVNGLAFSLHGPAMIGLIPQVVDRSSLQSANSLLAVAQSGAFAMGAALAGVLVATVGAGWAIAVDAATFAVSALLIALLVPRAQVRSAPTTLLRDLREGWREFSSHTWLWAIVLQFSLVVAAHEGVFAVLGPTVAKRELGGASDWGWIAASFGLGTVLGAVLSMRIHVKRPMLVASLLVFSFALPALLLSGPAPVPWIAFGALLHGICGQTFAVLWYTALHTHIAPDALSRVSAYDHLGSIALAPVGVIAAGFLLESIGGRPTLWLAAAAIVLPTLAVLCVRDVREMRTAVANAPESGAGGGALIVVSGLPRSGTSLMMQMLRAGGIPLTEDGKRRPDESNPRGYFEDERVKMLHQDNGWVHGAKGTALKVVAPLLAALPEGPDYRVIWMERDLDEILASQRRMLAAPDAPNEDLALRRAFEQELQSAEDGLTQRAVPLLKLRHEDVIAQPARVAERLREFLRTDFNVAAAAAVVEPELHRQRGS